jgi:YYY domain-containing protein
MTAFISWLFLITFLGWLTFPLAYYLFPALADRGYTLARAFGLLIWGYVFWLFASLGIAQNDIGGLLLGLVILGGLSVWAFVRCKSEITQWAQSNRRLILTTEILFLLAFGLMAFFRAGNPEILGTEKPMELMFISGIMNSPMFPPRDLWLSGYSISYYYFGYVMTSMIAMFTGVPATMAFNLMIALIFGLSAVGAYGILYNLLARYRLPDTDDQAPASKRPSIVAPLLAPLFLLVVSNVEGFLEILHSRGIFWSDNTSRFWLWLKSIDTNNLFWRPDVTTHNFWTWLDIPDLTSVPAQSLQWIPERHWWWWRASRVVQDYDLNGTFREAIDEFPFFSFLLGDLHPHVLAMPFTLLAIAVAFNLIMGGWRGITDLYFGQLRISKTGFFTIALVVGGLAFLNTWDILIAGALIVFSYALAQVRRRAPDGGEADWGWERIEDILLLGIPLLATAFLMYLPFYIGFDSQAGGLTPNFMYPTRGVHIWVMWGTLFVPLFAYLIYLWRSKAPAHWRAGISTTLGILLLLVVAMFALGFLALRLMPDFVGSILGAQGVDVRGFIAASMARRLIYVSSLLTLLALLIPALSFLFKSDLSSSSSFVLLMIALGALLILGPDYLYLRDNFGYRINTVFKFYYQAWIVLSLAAAYGIIVLLQNMRGVGNFLFRSILFLVLVVGLTYPAISIFSKTNNFKPPFGYTLDDFDRVQRDNPDEAAAILWLCSAPDGVLAEAQVIGGSYTGYGRISIYTGLPAVLGWPGHENQWRDQALQGSRLQDLESLYTTSDWITTQDIINRYNIRYIFVGNLERTTYGVNEDKFNRFLKPVFQQGNVTIYEAP